MASHIEDLDFRTICNSDPARSNCKSLNITPLSFPLLMVCLWWRSKSKFTFISVDNTKLIHWEYGIFFIDGQGKLHLPLTNALQLYFNYFFFISFLSLDDAAIDIDKEKTVFIIKRSSCGDNRLRKTADQLLSFWFFMLTILDLFLLSFFLFFLNLIIILRLFFIKLDKAIIAFLFNVHWLFFSNFALVLIYLPIFIWAKELAKDRDYSCQTKLFNLK